MILFYFAKQASDFSNPGDWPSLGKGNATVSAAVSTTIPTQAEQSSNEIVNSTKLNAETNETKALPDRPVNVYVRFYFKEENSWNPFFIRCSLSKCHYLCPLYSVHYHTATNQMLWRCSCITLP